uniref:TLC domain-containing protein n=1 Tax=Chelonoidis abingdonii TaxID=106734 RepID=A0A8C0GW07_CHEAB
MQASPALGGSSNPLSAPRHWLTSAYTQFAVPYFIYDIYAMFLCHWHKYRVKGHEGAGPRSLRTVTCAFLHKEFLMVLHHLCMVLVCFPVSVLWRQGKGDFFLGCMLRPIPAGRGRLDAWLLFPGRGGGARTPGFHSWPGGRGARTPGSVPPGPGVLDGLRSVPC